MTMSGDGEVRLSALIAPEFRELHKTLKSSSPAEWCGAVDKIVVSAIQVR